MYVLIKGILAGIAISFGGIAYLSTTDNIMGAFLFSLGLITVYLFDLYLFTGKACYIVGNPPKYLNLVFVTYIGNLIGTVTMGYGLKLTKLYKLIPKAQEIVEYKLQSTNFGGFLLAIGCGFMMYIAVIGYKTVTSEFGKYLVLIMPIVVFTISGFEHVIANMFYFSVANAWSVENAIYLVFVTAGNLLGCSFIPLSELLLKKLGHHEHV